MFSCTTPFFLINNLNTAHQVITAVAMQDAVFWGGTARRFRGTFRFHHQGQIESQARNQ
jgi:hypothetical protein